jgi:predicted amidohydrolase YtcJ
MRGPSLTHTAAIDVLVILTVRLGRTTLMTISAHIDVRTVDSRILGYPDSIFLNARVVTADSAFSIAEAVAIRDGRFLSIGTTREVQALAGPDTVTTDLLGATVLPGLIDTHAHVEYAGRLDLFIDFAGVTTAAEALERISEHAARTPHGKWIRGNPWHPVSQLVEKRYLTREELDRAAPDHPVCLPIGHFTLVNSLALSKAGVTRDTPDPAGGIIHRSSDGEPNGTLEEAAESLVHNILPDWTPEERADQMRAAMAYFNSFGITSAISAAVDPATLRAHQRLRDQHLATLRISAMYAPTGGINPSLDVEEWELLLSRIGFSSDFGDEWLSYSGVKLQIDGGMTLRTAAMREGYPHDRDYRGTIVIDPPKFNRLVCAANRYGWRVGVHAVGDAAIDTVLDAFELANNEHSVLDRRFIIIHGSLMQKDQMERAKRLGVRVDAQSSFLWEKAATVSKYLGRAVADRAFPMRTMIDIMGLDAVAQGTDYPFNPLNPFVNMYIMVTRKDVTGEIYGEREAISRKEAIRLYTSSASRYSFSESKTGSIEPGKLADMIVLSDDIMEVPDEKLKEISVIRTIVGGKTVYESAPGAA